MKTVRVEGQNYSIVVYPVRRVLRAVGNGQGEEVDQTMVSIYRDGMEHSGTGVAFCSPKDVFDGVTGINLALQRALKLVLVPRAPGTFALRSLTSAEKAKFYQHVLGVSRS